MDTYLHQVIWSNKVESYLIVLAILLFALAFKRIFSKYLAKLLYKLVSKAGKNVARESFLELVIHPLDIFIVLLIALIAFDGLVFPTAINFQIFKITLSDVIAAITNGVLIITVIWLCLRVIDFIALILEDKANLTNDQTDNQLIIFFKDFLKVLIVIIGILLVLRFSFNRNIGNLLTGLSIVGAAIALATRESMENLIASFIIFFDKPFTTGDLVKVNGFTGNIERIGLRSTRIRTQEKTHISVPNKQMVDTIVDNVTMRTQRKAEIKLEIDLNASAAQLKKLIQDIHHLIAAPFSQNNSVHLTDTGKNAHVINIEYFTDITQTLENFLLHKEQVTLQIIELMEQAGIKPAAASKDVLIYKAGE